MKKKWFPSPTISFVQVQVTKFFKNDVWSVEIVSDVNVIIFATQKYFLLFGSDESFEIITRKMISNALGNSYFLRKIWKWVLVNDLLAKKMISGLFWLKIKWLPPVRNDLREVWKWFSTQENDFERTQNDYRGNDFFEMLLQEFKVWFTLEKKNISTGNYYFRKWVEIIFFTEMPHNLRSSYAQMFNLRSQCISKKKNVSN